MKLSHRLRGNDSPFMNTHPNACNTCNDRTSSRYVGMHRVARSTEHIHTNGPLVPQRAQRIPQSYRLLIIHGSIASMVGTFNVIPNARSRSPQSASTFCVCVHVLHAVVACDWCWHSCGRVVRPTDQHLGQRRRCRRNYRRFVIILFVAPLF